MTKKKKRQVQTWTRAGIQILFFLFLPSAYSGAFAGLKDLFLKLGMGQKLAWTPFVALLCVLCGYTILFDRFFCGYACAFGSLGDWIFALHKAIAKKRKKPMKHMPRELAQGLTYMKMWYSPSSCCFAIGAYTTKPTERAHGRSFHCSMRGIFHWAVTR